MENNNNNVISEFNSGFACSNEMDQLFIALGALQSDMETVKKSDHGHRHRYSNIDTVLRMVRPLLHKHGLSVQQHPCTDSNGVTSLVTVLGHKSGQWTKSSCGLIFDPTDIQSLGGSISYNRRYAIVSILGIEQEDDNGNSNKSVARPAVSLSSNTTREPISAAHVADIEQRLSSHMNGDELRKLILQATKARSLDGLSEKQYYFVLKQFLS